MQSPYLPDIMQGVVQRVSDSFSARLTDPFAVFFDKGIQKQVGKSVYQKTSDKVNTWPLVWLVMPFTEKRDDFSIYANITCTVIIAMPTDGKYTQQQRDDNTFKPRLLPIYDALIYEISREKWFQFRGPGQISHTRTLRPYWGGADVEGPNNPNLFKKEVDAISITSLLIKINSKLCVPETYSLNKNV